MESEKKKRPPNFRLELPGDENYKIVIQEKSQIVKKILDQDFEEICQQFPCNCGTSGLVNEEKQPGKCI